LRPFLGGQPTVLGGQSGSLGGSGPLFRGLPALFSRAAWRTASASASSRARTMASWT
jgi:hypothetical protein